MRKIEQGESTDPRMSTRKAVAKALGVSLDVLTADNGNDAEPAPQKTGRKRGN